VRVETQGPRVQGAEGAWSLLDTTQTLKHPLRPPTTDHRPPTTDHRPPTTDHRPPTTDHRPPTTDHRPPTTDHRPPTTGHRSPTTDQSHPQRSTHRVRCLVSHPDRRGQRAAAVRPAPHQRPGMGPVSHGVSQTRRPSREGAIAPLDLLGLSRTVRFRRSPSRPCRESGRGEIGSGACCVHSRRSGRRLRASSSGRGGPNCVRICKGSRKSRERSFLPRHGGPGVPWVAPRPPRNARTPRWRFGVFAFRRRSSAGWKTR
jgi:hypothetical protein